MHVKASLVKAAKRNGALRKAQSFMTPPSGQVWGSDGKKHRFYFAGSVRIAMRVQVNGVGDQVYYLLTDHLGSTAMTVDVNGSKQAELRYAPWGTTRYIWGDTPTDYKYTGQREETGIGLYFYQSRFYDAYLNRWVQPDSIVPLNSQGVQAWDRFAYANNNPVKFNDSSGHMVSDGCEYEGCDSDTEPAPGIDKEHHQKLSTLQSEAELLSTLMKLGRLTDTEALARLMDFAAPIYAMI